MWNDKETDVDLLGNDKIAQTVIEIIGDSNLRPLTIGVYGDWGVGKSSILSILQSKVKAEKVAKVSNNHCILFNGWLFQGYEDAKTALMETVVTELAELQPANKKVQKFAKSLLGRINWLKVAKFSAGALLTGITGLPVAGIIGEGISRVKKMTEYSDDDSMIKEEEKEETVTSQIHAFRKEFKKLISSSKVDHIIVLVDDLDRCLPKSVIEILEAIRLFLFVEGTTFVISADERMIEYAVKEHFPNLPASYTEYTKNYLEKLIQIPIRIPTLTKQQTGNYIKLLMLQNYLKNDSQQLKTVYQAYEDSKKRPYEALELTYEIIKEAIGASATSSTELQETLLVAGQLTPTLSLGLKGNPRNIKRFLNTLFLRMKISKIYGLDDIVELKILAKLMLLERFQTATFDKIVEEVSSTPEGTSKSVKDTENEKEKEGEDNSGQIAFKEWSLLEPKIGSTDLRPYIFISKEKAIGFDSDGSFPEHLVAFFKQLNSGNEIILNKAEKDLVNINAKEKILLFEKLEVECHSISDLSRMPAPFNGLLRIVRVDSTLETRLIKILESFPSTNLGVWSISQLSGLRTSEANQKFAGLLHNWEQQNENQILKKLAKQTLALTNK
ncbi:Qat anti-phage system ATPase QatA [Emticicia sp. 17c]|uniref:Qat anti-phage system ATPase QatA n=1 Tax=Emticicia sp. 17c TaxID=3127704 RepID=UPI00301C5C0D